MKKLKITETELNSLGYQVDPLDESKAIPKPTNGDSPSEHWDLEKLAEYARGSLDLSISLARKSTIERFRAGHALSIARAKFKENKKGWCQWQDDHNIPRTKAWEAIKLYKRAGSEKVVADLQITEAFKKFGIVKPRKRRADSETLAGAAHAIPEAPPQLPENDEAIELPENEEGTGEEAVPAKLKLHNEPKDEMPPPKEDPSSLARILSGIVYRLEDIVDGLADAELASEERETICGLSTEGVRLLTTIIEKVQA